MNSFIKENASLVIALALPVIFAMFFYFFKDTKKQNVPPPQYDFVITNHNSRDSYDFAVIDQNLNVAFTYQTVRGNARPYTVKQPNLFYVDAETLIAEPINVNIPPAANNPPTDLQGTRMTLEISKFDGKTFSAASISPDGFELTYYNGHRDGNIMTEIFSGHRNRDRGLMLVKDGAKFDIRGLDRHYGYQVIGWVTGDAE